MDVVPGFAVEVIHDHIGVEEPGEGRQIVHAVQGVLFTTVNFLQIFLILLRDRLKLIGKLHDCTIQHVVVYAVGFCVLACSTRGTQPQ